MTPVLDFFFPILDIFLVIVALAALFSGYRQGGFSAVLSLAGVAGGGFLGVKAVPLTVDLLKQTEYDTQSMRLLVALSTVVILTITGYGLGQVIGFRLRDQIRTRTVLRAESLVGAGVTVITYLLFAWLVLTPIGQNQQNQYGQAVRDSTVLSTINRVAPDWLHHFPQQVNQFISAAGFPVIANPVEGGPGREVSVPINGEIDGDVVATTQSRVVRVLGQATQCSRIIQGSGWVMQDDTVMTNAHVVAGTDSVQLETDIGTVDARVVYYNPQQDIAILRTGAMGLEPLPWSDREAESGEAVTVMGYPQGGPFTASPARVRQELRISGPNIYGEGRVERETYSLRATVVHGNSGGPLVDSEGRVLGLIFGADVQAEETGYALTRAEIDEQVGDVEQWQDTVATGQCVQH